MLASMTAYGRSDVAAPFGRLVVEIQSVNRRFLEVIVHLPTELSRFEIELKRWVADAMSRGQVTVRVFAFFQADSPVRAVPNLPLAKELKKAWTEIAQCTGIDPSSFSLALLANEQELIRYDEDSTREAPYRQALRQGFDAALNDFLVMRAKEGKALSKDVMARLDTLRQGIDAIALKAPGCVDRYREKLSAKIEACLPGHVENQERLLREVCVYADKVDIAEEITRFQSHLQQFAALMQSPKGGAGKTLEFLIQELLREANTIGSKASDVDVIHQVVGLKSELERVREQLQNVE